MCKFYKKKKINTIQHVSVNKLEIQLYNNYKETEYIFQVTANIWIFVTNKFPINRFWKTAGLQNDN